MLAKMQAVQATWRNPLEPSDPDSPRWQTGFESGYKGEQSRFAADSIEQKGWEAGIAALRTAEQFDNSLRPQIWG